MGSVVLNEGLTDDLAFDADVVVVGAGPTGGVAALALATLGVDVHVVSRDNWTADTPRAHITNQRALEVLRDLGIEDEAHRYATPWGDMGDTLFTTSLAGEEIARLRTWGTGDERISDYLLGSPCPLLDIPQHLLEPVVIKNAARRGATVSFNTEYRSHTQDAEGVTVALFDHVSGSPRLLRARYLIGADGARSMIADELGLPFVGEMGRAGTAYVVFDADLSSYVEHRRSILYWIVNSSAGFGEIGMGLLRCIRPWDQWIAGWGFDIADGAPDLGEETMTEKIRILVGDSELQPFVHQASTWYVNQQHAERYSKGRVFCGGDAVHRHPPSSGLGSNTCMQDAFNLAWKLAYVIHGYASPDVLESYTEERAPVGRQVVARANQSRKDYALLRTWYDHEADDPVSAGLKRLRAPTLEGAKLRDDLGFALELKNTEFNAHGVELNQRYDSRAVLPDSDAEEAWENDPQLYLQPTTRPGAHLPHAWLVGTDGRRVSTLDVVGHGALSLVTGLSGSAWVEAVSRLELPFLRAVTIGTPDTQDLYGAWRRVCEIDDAGAVLVRPDGYVAWRHISAEHESISAERKLEEALVALLGHGLSEVEESPLQWRDDPIGGRRRPPDDSVRHLATRS